jgi:predicted nucleic acid-binding protein
MLKLGAKRKTGERWLVFVDTNILLDFYRKAGESAARQLQALERHKDALIVTDQVHLEFLKNRQVVLANSLTAMSRPPKPVIPSVLTDFRSASGWETAHKGASRHCENLKARFKRLLEDPARHDPVFRALTPIFESDAEINLKRPDKRCYGVRALARKRFLLGYPPRKPNDTSIGDAINWEWIVHCAKWSTENHHVVIVSRDSDYGINGDVLNDWLQREFRERVGRTRKIELTNRLTDAFRKLSERVTAEDLREEETIIAREQKAAAPAEPDFAAKLRDWLTTSVSTDRAAIEALNRLIRAKEPPG